MNNAVLNATGDWDTTSLYNNDQEVSALEFHLEINAGQGDGYGNVSGGGIVAGSEIVAYVREVDTPSEQFPIFPGRIEMTTPNGQVIVENNSVAGVNAPDATTVFYQGAATNGQMFNVTRGVISLLVNINYDTNIQEVRLSLYKHHTFSWLWGSDEIYNVTLL